MVKTERDEESGKLSEQYPDDAFLQAVKKYEPASTMEVADAVGCSRRNADVRLKRLAEEGAVRSKLVGNSLTWLYIK